MKHNLLSENKKLENDVGSPPAFESLKNNKNSN